MKSTIEKIFLKIKKGEFDPRMIEDCVNLITSVCEDDLTYGREKGKELYRLVSSIRTTDVEMMKSIVETRKRLLLIEAPYDFDSYMIYLEWDREPSKRFYLPRRKILRKVGVVQAMQDIADGNLDLLTISMPPGSGKSTLGIFFLTWIMGRNPDKCNLASAHSGFLTRSFYDGVLQIINDPDYLYKDVFPNSPLAVTNSKEETIDLVKPHRFSTLTCRAINASLTGATRCEGILYADDLVSGIEEALSKDRLDSLWSKYTNDLKSRKKLGCAEIHIATRWSVHDPIGRLERMYGDDPRARFVVVPALDENDESNFDYQYGVGFDTEYFHDMRDNLDDASFKALYMNEPIEREGLLYHEDELRRYFELPVDEPDAVVTVCDTKDKGKDYCVMPIAYKYGENYYIEDCVCNNGLPDVIDNMLVNILIKHNVKVCRFESNSAGGRVAQKVQADVKSKGGHTHITTKYTTANKETKIIVNSAFVKEHFLFKDKSLYTKKSEYGELMNQMTSYTVMGKNKHDDVPDAMSMLAEFVQGLAINNVEVMKRPF